MYRVWEGIMRYETVDQNQIPTNLLYLKLWYKNDIVQKRSNSSYHVVCPLL